MNIMMEQSLIVPLANLCVYVQIPFQYIVVHCLNYVYAKYALSVELILISDFYLSY